MIETPQYGLTIFKVHFGALTLKGCTKGEHVMRFEAVCHNTNALHVGRVLDRFPDIVNALAAMLERFCTTLDRVDVAFIPDGILDRLPQPTTIAATRVGGINLEKARTPNVLAAIVALAAAPDGFSVAELATKVHAITGNDSYSIRQGACDIRRLRGQDLVTKIGRSRRYQVPTSTARTIVAILTLRDHVISPIIAGVRVPRRGRPPATWTLIDRDYENLRVDMHKLFHDLASPPPHRQRFVDQEPEAPRESLRRGKADCRPSSDPRRLWSSWWRRIRRTLFSPLFQIFQIG